MSASTSSSTRRRSSSAEPRRATIETDAGTVMVVRTAAGAFPAEPVDGPEESDRALSAAAACAEASRDVWALGAEAPEVLAPGEVSGKNPRPCLPESDEADPPSLPAETPRHPGLARWEQCLRRGSGHDLLPGAHRPE